MPKNAKKKLRTQGAIWIATIPKEHWTPSLPPEVNYIKGQLERGEQEDYEHWQLLIHFKNKIRLGGVKRVFPSRAHYELTRSEAAEAYVWKIQTRIGEPFELGKKPFKRNSAIDWDIVKQRAKEGDLDNADIPADIFVRYFGPLTSISRAYVKPDFREIGEVVLFWGPTGCGKSHTAFESARELGGDAGFYSKNIRSKFWDGYRGQETVVFDEFRGAIAVDYLLRWLDKYPTLVDTKGSSQALKARNFFFTSNVPIVDWYENLDTFTLAALKRRFTRIEYREIAFLPNIIH